MGTFIPVVLLALGIGFFSGRYFERSRPSGNGVNEISSASEEVFSKKEGFQKPEVKRSEFSSSKTEERLVLSERPEEVRQEILKPEKKYAEKIQTRLKKHVDRYQDKIANYIELDEASRERFAEVFDELDLDYQKLMKFLSGEGEEPLTQQDFDDDLRGLMTEEQKVKFQEWSDSRRAAQVESRSLAQIGRVGELISLTDEQRQQVYEVLTEEVGNDIQSKYEISSYVSTLADEAFGRTDYDDFGLSGLWFSKEWKQAEDRNAFAENFIREEAKRRVGRFSHILDKQQLRLYQEEVELEAEGAIDMIVHVLDKQEK